MLSFSVFFFAQHSRLSLLRGRYLCPFNGYFLCIQLFRERLSEKVHATIVKGIMGGFEFSFSQRNLKELARKAMEMCLRVLKESNKVGSTATVVRNSVLIISYITFRDCRVHIFSDNLSRNSCIHDYKTGMGVQLGL